MSASTSYGHSRPRAYVREVHTSGPEQVQQIAIKPPTSMGIGGVGGRALSARAVSRELVGQPGYCSWVRINTHGAVVRALILKVLGDPALYPNTTPVLGDVTDISLSPLTGGAGLSPLERYQPA